MNKNVIEVLMIEDNPHDAELTVRALKKKNFVNNIVHLKDGQEAIDFIFAKGAYASRDIMEKPHLVLLDLKLPKVGGLEVLRAVKSDERTKTIPVVVLTSSREEPDLVEAYRLGANSYIVKPVEFEKFVEAISVTGSYWLLLNQAPAT